MGTNYSSVSLLLFAALGWITLGSMAGCQQDLDLDRVHYLCSSDSDCGAGYTCEEHAEHGRVCLSQPPVAGDDVGGDDDGGGDQDSSTPGSEFVVNVTNQSQQTLSSVQVYLVENATEFDCAEAIADLAGSWTTKEVPVGGGQEIPAVRFTVDQVPSAVFATGLSADGVRVGVGCEEGLEQVDDATEAAVDVTLYQQLPIFAPEYRVSMGWSIEDFVGELGLYDAYIRALARLPIEPGTALLGCKGATESALCDGFTEDPGLMDLIAQARNDFGPPGAGSLARIRMAYLEDLQVRSRFREALNDSTYELQIDVSEEELWDVLLPVLTEALVMSASADVSHTTVNVLDNNTPESSDFSGTFTVDGVGVNICDGDLSCAGQISGALRNPIEFTFNNGVVSPSQLGFSEPKSVHVSGLNLGEYFTSAFEEHLYPAAIQGEDFDARDGFANFLNQERWPCGEIAEYVVDDSANSGMVTDIEAWCNEFSTPGEFEDIIENYLIRIENQYSVELQIVTECALAEVDYSQSEWWQQGVQKPMPVFTSIGKGQPCEWALEGIAVDGTLSTMQGSFSAEVEPQQ